MAIKKNKEVFATPASYRAVSASKKVNLAKPMKKGGSTDKKWIQKAVNPEHKGYCTPMSKPTCTPKRKALARTFKAMAKARKKK